MQTLLRLSLAALSLAIAVPAFGQQYPNRPIRLIVPYPAGGATDVVARIAARNGWVEHWLNDAVSPFLSPLAQPAKDLVIWGTFPRAADKTGMTVFVPTARYLLALKLKALRVAKFEKGTKDLADVAGLLRVLDIKDADAGIAVLTEFFPNSAADAEKARFVLKHILTMESPSDAPRYPRRDI